MVKVDNSNCPAMCSENGNVQNILLLEGNTEEHQVSMNSMSSKCFIA